MEDNQNIQLLFIHVIITFYIEKIKNSSNAE
jgi:hypothetical protein